MNAENTKFCKLMPLPKGTFFYDVTVYGFMGLRSRMSEWMDEVDGYSLDFKTTRAPVVLKRELQKF